EGDLVGWDLRRARLPRLLQDRWVWWRLDAPPARNTDLAALLESDDAVPWRSARQTEALAAQMSPLHRQRLEAAVAAHGRAVGAAYRRIRVEAGVRVQRAEVRLDGLAGCLRTPAGGSSKQLVVVAGPAGLRSRLITAREGARLMGLPETYALPASAHQALHVIGDGVAVPVVDWLARGLLEPLLAEGSAVLAAE
ncbi:MAG TPA: DNA cytosine methyltransferase, partial [Phenylobacterium sp.]|nr:DNA cytosine methyltransferase [Phenylobacterium sp.]